MKSHCNTCGGEREHKVLHEQKTGGEEQFDVIDDHGDSIDCSIQWGATYRLLQCRGCEDISMRKDSWNSEDTEHNGKPVVTTKFLPPRIFRPKPKWMEDKEYVSGCPEQIQNLLNEIYICLQNDCRSSAAMCVRAIFEGVMIDKIGDQKSFARNIGEFEKQGYISKKQKEIIEPVLEAGHASIHRAYIPKTEQLATLVDILENIIPIIYIHPQKTAALKKGIPARKK